MKQASNQQVLISALLTAALIRGSYGPDECSNVEGTPHFIAASDYWHIEIQDQSITRCANDHQHAGGVCNHKRYLQAPVQHVISGCGSHHIFHTNSCFELINYSCVLHKFYYSYVLRVTKLYHVTKFQMLVYSG